MEHILKLDDLLNASFLDIEQLGRQFGASVVVAPHPDDEALGCGGIISYLRSQNIPVFVVFMTSGGKSHPNSKNYPTERLTALRESEALKSCEILGVPEDCVFFYQQPDGELSKLNDDELLKLEEKLTVLFTENSISSVFLPWRRDAHPDHIISNRIGFEAVKHCKGEIQIVEYPIWLWKNSQEKDWPREEETTPFRLQVEPVLDQKRDAIYAHESQTSGLISDDPRGFILTDDLLLPFLGANEYFFIKKLEKMAALDKQFFESLYQDNSDPWNFKHSDYEHQKYQKTEELLGGRHYEKGLELGCSIGIQTAFFAKHCNQLLSVDVSKEAIADAERNNEELTNVDFQALDVMHEFPEDTFDFISMCEMGYYFDEQTLLAVFKKVSNHLVSGGEFLMVHWTSYVREFPLHGTDVNKIFMKFNSSTNTFSCKMTYKHDKYEFFLWQKN